MTTLPRGRALTVANLVVTRRSARGGKYFHETPLLVVEVLSPGNRLQDLNTKYDRYERAGIPSYWVVDPESLRLVVWELRDGRYVEVADVGPDEEWRATQPFEVTIRPGSLLD